MRKVSRNFECPIDNFFIDLADPFLDFFYDIGITPNIITTAGNIVRLLSIYHLDNNVALFSLFYIWGYQFDCLDGYFARKYNMCSAFGDVYDHVSDTFFAVFVAYHIYNKSWFHVLVYIFMLLMMSIHLGCVQKYYQHNTKEYLDLFNLSFIDKKWITWTRYFGCGTFIFASCLLCI